jgi:hypothetical protein
VTFCLIFSLSLYKGKKQRCPAGGLVCQEDAACNRLAELALNDTGTAGQLLKQAASASDAALAAVDDRDAHASFQAALRATLQVS